MANAEKNPEPMHHPHRGRMLAILLFVALFLVPVTYYGFNGERARWKQARAILLADQGKTTEALELLEKGVEESPLDVPLKLELANMLARDQQIDRAVELLDQALELLPDNGTILRGKGVALARDGRYGEALEAIGQIPLPPRATAAETASHLNEQAYIRALAGKETLQALDNIQQAILLAGSRFWWMEGIQMPLEDTALVASALLARHLNDRQEIDQLLDRRIETYEESLAARKLLLSSSIYRLMTRVFPFSNKNESGIRNDVSEIESTRQFLAILRSVRAIRRQDAGENRLRDRDRIRVQQLGFDPEQLLAVIPDDWELLVIASEGAQLLDTRGVTFMARNSRSSRESALEDLDIAVIAVATVNASSAGALQNSVRDESGTQFQPRRLQESEAVIRKHRADLLSRMGRDAASNADLDAIKELGFDPDELLF